MNDNKILDLVIIGGGPAGLTASIYASRAKLDFLLVEKAVLGGQVLTGDFFENYPAFPEGIKGIDLAEKFSQHAMSFKPQIEYKEILSITANDNNKIKELKFNDRVVKTKAVIIATGTTPKKLGIPGEEKFFGKGISVCATCDAPFYKDKVILAVGGGDTAVQEALYLTSFAEKVYLVHRRDQLRAIKTLQEKALANDKIEIIWDSALTKVDGLFNVEAAFVKNLKTNEERRIEVSGCFIWVGINPNSSFCKGFIETDNNDFIITDEKMQCSIEGVFAAGDVRKKALRQVSTAVGDAATAVMSAVHYLEMQA